MFKNKNKNKIYKILVLLIISIFIINYSNEFMAISINNEEPYDKEKIKKEIEDIYSNRSSSFVTGNITSLEPYFDTSSKYGTWALEHEIQRAKYLNDWSTKRRLKFTNINSEIDIRKITPNGEKTKIFLDEKCKFDYIYPDDENPVTNTFVITLTHNLTLINKNNTTKVYCDWYTDCFEDSLSSYSGKADKNLIPYNGNRNISNFHFISYNHDTSYNSTVYNFNNQMSNYDREAAARYADKYCGTNPNNNIKFNTKYMNFSGAGGDCTNFISQALGDKEEGGGIPQDYTWKCNLPKYGRAQGSKAWVNATALKNYLVYSGKGSLIKRGNFEALTTSYNNEPSPVNKAMIADLLCYEKKGKIDHFSIITSRDSHGYLLVNSHTTNRYHVPWDLGWSDKEVDYILIHIH